MLPVLQQRLIGAAALLGCMLSACSATASASNQTGAKQNTAGALPEPAESGKSGADFDLTPPPLPALRPATAPSSPKKTGDKPAANFNKTLSSSKQFTVYCDDATIRSNIASQIEEYKNHLLAALGSGDQWKYPISIHLSGKAGDPVLGKAMWSELRLLEGVPLFVINVNLAHGLDQEQFSYLLYESLIYELSMRKLKPAQIPAKIKLPDWLVHGLVHAVSWQRNPAKKEQFARMFNSFNLPEVKELLARKNIQQLDLATKGLYECACAALVLCLLEQTGGNTSLYNMLCDALLHQDPDELARINKFFPAFALSAKSLEKWWALQQAKMSQIPLNQIIPPLQCEERLQTVLSIYDSEHARKLDLADPKNAAGFKDPHVELVAELKQAQYHLLHLNYRCFADYRPIILAYMRIINDIIHQLPKQHGEELQKLQQQRENLKKAALRARDYLDWYEITHARQGSASFDEYLRTSELLNATPSIDKDDHLQQYLFDIEQLMQQK